jgi:hypothetical protein
MSILVGGLVYQLLAHSASYRARSPLPGWAVQMIGRKA